MRKTFICVALAFMGALHTLAKDVVDYVTHWWALSRSLNCRPETPTPPLPCLGA